MKPHKWAKEIKAWADGAEIEYWNGWSEKWILCVGMPPWDNDEIKFRIKPQPKEPKYLYVYCDKGGAIKVDIDKSVFMNGVPYIGKIKLETDDE